MISYRPRKRFAQHWLRSDRALEAIITAADLKPDDRILEIGAGTGVLTRKLLEYDTLSSLLAVEIDRDLCKKLVKTFGKKDKFLLLQGDFLELDLAALVKDFPEFQNPNKVVANIPYNITGPILEKLLGKISQPVKLSYDLIVLLIQKEVAERLVAQPGCKQYGALSVKVQYLAQCELVCTVPAKAFYPPPKVDSAVVKLIPQKIAHPANDPCQLETLVKVGFANKRKMLRNNLKSLMEIEKLMALLEQLNINIQARAEDLSLQDWVNLSNHWS